ncbi:MAG: 5-formyltetrahydrofolate cyclo-ligase [Gammaproteobacteria bacterium]
MKDDLRRSMRAARRALSGDERHRAATSLTRIIATTAWYRDSRTIAAYVTIDGEIDLTPITGLALEAGKRVFLPIVEKDGLLRFAESEPGASMRPNRYGVPEPSRDTTRFIDCRELDLALVPVVAFDAQGQRLGMGAGFYDRTFAFLNAHPRAARPILLGVAFDLQFTAKISPDPWDVRLNGVVTERRLYDPRDANRASSARDD